MQFIQGKQRSQSILFPESLDEIIEKDNEVRIIDLFVESINVADFKFVIKTTKEGRPAYHPKDLLKLFVYGYGAYGFNDQKWKGEFDAMYLLNRSPRSYLYGSYVNDFDSTEPGIASLTFSLVGYVDPGSERMKGTIAYVTEKLCRNGFTYRYLDTDDGLPGNEGAFIVGNFWLIENFAKSGRIKEAINLFDHTIKNTEANKLLAEEIDPGKMEWLGNYPQAFSHIGLINAALSINEELEKNKPQWK